jgi:hypothetical protein
MSKHEQRILLTQARPDMELARAVALPNQMVLCGAGQLLSEDLITRLMSRGIKRVFVRGNPLPAPDHSNLQESIAQLHRRFSRVRNVYIMELLLKTIEAELVRRYQ